MIGVLLVTGGCGGGNNGSTPPPIAPSGTVVSITVSSSGSSVYLGGVETFTATATLSTGGTQSLLVGTWSTSSAAIATVDSATGKVTGVATGTVTISLDYQGVHGSKPVRVVPFYAGNWAGSYIVSGCTQAQGFSDTNQCSNFPIGKSLQYGLQLAQAFDVVSGTTNIGLIGMSGDTETIQPDGSLNLTTNAFAGTTTIVASWTLISQSAGVLGGTLSQHWTDSAITGSMDITATLNPPTRLSAVGRALDGRREPPRSLAEVLAAVRTSLTSGF
jgi:Big-like domain-containing protein